MAFEVHVVTAELPFTTVGETVDFVGPTGLGTPTAAAFFVSNASSTNNPSAALSESIGFWRDSDDTQNSAGIYSADNVATSRCHRTASNTAALRIISHNGTSYTTQAEYTAVGITDGVQLELTTDNTGVGRYCVAVLFYGTSNVYVGSVTTSASDTGTVDVTDPGFKPDFVLFSGNGLSASDGTEAIFSYGFAHNSSTDTVTQRCVMFFGANNQTTSKVNTGIRNNGCIGRYTWDGGTWDTYAAASDFDASGFTLTTTTTTATGTVAKYLAIEVPDPDAIKVGTITTGTATGNEAETGFGFEPGFIAFLLSTLTAENSFSASPTTAHGYGFADADGQYSLAAWMQDNKSTATEVGSQYNATNALMLLDHTGATDALGTVASFDADGITMNWSNAPASARVIPYWAVEAVAGGQTGTGSLTTAIETISGTGVIGHTGTGALTTSEATLSGAGTLTHTGTGDLTTSEATLSGEGAITHTGTGGLTTGEATLSGDGTVTSVGAQTGTGALTLDAVTASGSGVITHKGTGALTTSEATLSGAGVLSHTGTGDLTTTEATVSGEYVAPEVGTGSATCSTLDSDGNSFLPANLVLDSDGNSFTVSNSVLDSDGNEFVVCIANAVPVVPSGGGGTSTSVVSGRRRKQKLILVERVEDVEELLEQIDEIVEQSPKTKAKAKVQKPTQTVQEAPQAAFDWLAYYDAQLSRLRDQQRANSLRLQLDRNAELIRAIIDGQQLAQQHAQMLQMQQDEEDLLLLLMAA